jgi:outer membrane biosynthesis protein TonB
MRIPFTRKSQQRSVADVPAATQIVAVATAPASGATHPSLADIIGRRTPIRWFEAVAIVDAVASAVAGTGDSPIPDLPVPDLADAFLSPDGRIEIGSRHSTHVGVQPLARMLHVLVTGEQVPPPLRLFISRWIEAESGQRITDFTQALAYFVRPDGASLIRGVYERYLTMPDLPAGGIIPKPELDPPKAAKPERRRIPRWVAVATVVVCVGGGLLAWALTTSSSEASAGGTLARVVEDGRKVLNAAREGLAQRFGIGTSSAPETPKAAVTVPDPVRRPRARTVAPPSLPELPTLQIPVARQSFDPAHTPFLITPAESISSATAADDPIEPEPVEDLSAGILVYTTADLEVEPPQMVYPHLPRVPYTGPDVNSMEVVIGEDGSVERVRLLSAARRMTDMMLLSGAKSWRFAPALRDGQPVRYRITINWSATQ